MAQQTTQQTEWNGINKMFEEGEDETNITRGEAVGSRLAIDSSLAYWEVTDLRKQLICEHFKSDWSTIPPFLQLYDVTDIYFNGFNALTTLRIPVHPLTDNWYIHNVQSLLFYGPT